MTTPHITRVEVKGLHNQFDFEIELSPGLNILYGLNGKGKTTLLHLLANLLELDFQRFSHLQFQEIKVRTSAEATIILSKDQKNETIEVVFDGRSGFFANTIQSISSAEFMLLRQALGGLPTYLPAFRAILERARTDSRLMYRSPDRREEEHDQIVQREFQAYRDYSSNENLSSATRQSILRLAREGASVVADKTLLCRHWFGKFVPVIRYPSVADVEESLSEEWRVAAIQLSGNEQRVFERTFVSIFRAISGVEQISTDQTNEQLISAIAELLADQDSPLADSQSRSVYTELSAAVKRLDAHLPSPSTVDQSAVLELYRSALETRNNERRAAFQQSRDFEQSVNRFLDGKRLMIGQTANLRPRGIVTVTTANDQTYGLSALSSGERQILTMLYSASRSPLQTGVFLIDEPELSLHIDWQRIILRELQRQAPDRQFIACTHSPEVGADHISETQDFVSRVSGSVQEDLFDDEEV